VSYPKLCRWHVVLVRSSPTLHFSHFNARSHYHLMLFIFTRPSVTRDLHSFPTRRSSDLYRERRPATIARTLDRRAMVEYMSRLGGKDSLVPVYDEASFRWLLERLAERHALGPLEEVEVLDEAGAVIGWFIYAFGPDSRAEVVQMAALDDRHPDVFTQLCYHAWQRGAITVRGRLDPQFVKCFK